MPLTYVLYINLDEAQQRRRNVEEQIRQFLPAAVPRRIPAVNGRAFMAMTTKDVLVLSPWAKLVLQQPRRASAHAQIETEGAVGCYLSHMRCWDWLLMHPEVPAILVLEDDACFAPNFAAAWDATVEPLLRVPDQWDVLMLGFFALEGNLQMQEVAGVSLRTFGLGDNPKSGAFHAPPTEGRGKARDASDASFFGTHGYLLTQNGARMLQRHAFPIEVQVDHYLLVLQQLGRLRLHLLPGPEVVLQCLGNVDVGIQHGFRPVTSPSLPVCRDVPPFSSWGWLLLITGCCCCLVSMCLLRIRRCGRPPNATTIPNTVTVGGG